MSAENFEELLKQILKNDDIETIHQQLARIPIDDMSEENRKALYLLDQILQSGRYIMMPDQEIVSRKTWGKSQKSIIDGMKALIPDVQNEAVQVLLCDAVWYLTQDYLIAKQAYETYAHLVETSSDTEKILSYLNRMMYIASACNQQEWKLDLETIIQSTLLRCIVILNFRPYQTLQYALEKELITGTEAIGLIDQFAEAIEKMNPTVFSPNLYDSYLRLKEELIAKSKGIALPAKTYSDPDLISVRTKRIESLMKVADRTKNRPRQVEFWKKVCLLAKPISKNLPGGITMLSLEKKLDEAQKKMMSEQKKISVSVDTSEIQSKLMALCEGKTSKQLFLLFLSAILFKNEKSFEEDCDSSSELGFSQFSKITLNQDGKQMAILPALNVSDSKSSQSHAVSKCKEVYDILSFSVGNTLFAQMYKSDESRTVAKELIAEIVKYSVIIPQNRKKAFTIGLSAGIDCDFCTAISILAPQMENIFLVLAENCGQIPYTLKEDGTQSRMTMEKMLSFNEVHECLDENILFNLKVLFTSPYGYNIRNRIAHGMCDDVFFQSYEAFWIWCMILKFCFLFYGPPSRLEDQTAQNENI